MGIIEKATQDFHDMVKENETLKLKCSALERQLEEQCRINGLGGNRELKLMTDIRTLEERLCSAKKAFDLQEIIIARLEDKIKSMVGTDADEGFGNEYALVCHYKEQVKQLEEKLKVAEKALSEIVSWCQEPDKENHCKIAECHVSREALSKIRCASSNRIECIHVREVKKK